MPTGFNYINPTLILIITFFKVSSNYLQDKFGGLIHINIINNMLKIVLFKMKTIKFSIFVRVINALLFQALRIRVKKQRANRKSNTMDTKSGNVVENMMHARR